MTIKSGIDPKAPERAGLSRRDVLAITAAVAVGAAIPASGAQAASPASFGAPVVELYVPPGVLTLEQKGAVIKGFTDVILGALKMPPDPGRRLFMTIVETAEGGFGVNGQVFKRPGS